MDVEAHILLCASPLPAAELLAGASRPTTGALASFLGLTRTPGLRGRPVARLEFEAFQPMARRVLADLCREAQARAGGALACVVVAHRLGAVPLGEASLLVAVSSPHRAEALAAVPWLVDAIKARAPVWKKEVYTAEGGGGGEWVGACTASGGHGGGATDERSQCAPENKRNICC